MDRKRTVWFLILLFLFWASSAFAQNLSIDDVSKTEGNSGESTAVFTVTLSPVSIDEVKVTAATADNTATGGSPCGNGVDYVSLNETLTFNPGETSKSFSVTVCGDTEFEADETFLVNLTNGVNAGIADNQGQGTISNDDAQVLDSFSFDQIGDQTGNQEFSITVRAKDKFNNTVTGFTDTATLTSSGDLQGEPLTSNAFIAGVLTQNVTITTVATSITLTAAGNGKTGTSNSFNVNPGTINKFSIAVVQEQIAGVKFKLDITAEDTSGNKATGFVGNVTIKADEGSVTPSTCGPFTNGTCSVEIALDLVGTRTLTVTNAEDSTHAGTSNSFLVTQDQLLFAVELTESEDDSSECPIMYTTFDVNGDVPTGLIFGLPHSENDGNPLAEATEESFADNEDDGFPEPDSFTIAARNKDMWIPVPWNCPSFEGMPAVIFIDGDNSQVLILVRDKGGTIWYTIMDYSGSSAAYAKLAAPPLFGNTQNIFSIVTEGSINDGWAVDPRFFPNDMPNVGLWMPLSDKTFAYGPTVVKTSRNGDLLIYAVDWEGVMWYTYYDLNGSSTSAVSSITEAPFSNKTGNPFVGATEGDKDDGFVDPKTFRYEFSPENPANIEDPARTICEDIWCTVPGGGRFASAPALLRLTGGDLLLASRGLDNGLWTTLFDLDGSLGKNEGPLGAGSRDSAFTAARGTEGPLVDGWPDGATIPEDIEHIVHVGPWVRIPGPGSTMARPLLVPVGGDVLIFIIGLNYKVWHTLFDADGSAGENALIAGSPFNGNTDNYLVIGVREGIINDDWIDGGTIQNGAKSVGIWVPFGAAGAFTGEGISYISIAGTDTDILVCALGLDNNPWCAYFDLNGNAGPYSDITEHPFNRNTDNFFVKLGKEDGSNDGLPNPNLFTVEANSVDIWLRMPGDKVMFITPSVAAINN